MPDVRLSGDFKGHKAGEIVDLSNDEFSEADAAQVVGKVYQLPVPGVPRSGRKPAKKAAARKKATKKAPSRPRLQSFGDKPDDAA